MAKIEWNRVTWYSKLAAVIVFLATFGIAFQLGILYEQVNIQSALYSAGPNPLVQHINTKATAK